MMMQGEGVSGPKGVQGEAFVLHCFAQSGNAYKPALMLHLAGAPWRPRFVDYFGGETRSAAYRGINVMGEVPVLEHGARRITQSGVILHYLARTLGRFGANTDAEADDILRWILFDNHKLTSYTATLRFMRTFTKDPDPVVVAFLRTRAEAAWRILDAHLATRPYVAADRLTIADLSLAGYLFWPEEIGVGDWSGFPNLAQWLERIRSEPRWVAAYDLMPGHPRPAAAA